MSKKTNEQEIVAIKSRLSNMTDELVAVKSELKQLRSMVSADIQKIVEKVYE
jgi:flagellar hook-associated protein FlgK